MLGMRGVKDRWTEAVEKAMGLFDRAETLIIRTTDYMDEVKKMTLKLTGVIEQQQKVLEQDLELKRAQTKLAEMEMKNLECEATASTAREKKKK